MRQFIVLLLCLNISTFTFAQRQIIDQVIANVGSEFIQLSEIEEQFSLISAQQGGLPPEARCQILDQIMGQKLLLNQSRLDSIEVSDGEVESQLNARIERILSYMQGDLRQFESYYGQTVNEVKDEFREDLRNQILTDRMRSNIVAGITVTPSEVKAFFHEIPKDSLPYFNSEVEVGEIAIFPEVNDEQRSLAIKQLEDIKQRIENGEDFADLARKFSNDPGSGRAGGDLGWTTRGKFVPEFEAEAYTLEINELSDIVESEFGFHLIQLQGRRGNSINTRHILIKPLITENDLALARKKLDSIRQLIVSDSISFSRAVKRFGSDKVQSYNNDGRMTNPLSGNTFFEVGDLDPDIYFTIDTMKVGAISNTFEFTNPYGEIGYRIVQLQSQTAPHKASLELDYSKIQQAAIEAKKNDYINQWISERVDATFIQVNELYRRCPVIEKWITKEVRP
jgi:peptidyl-prolyl cis-trans isomerase SurA